MNKNRIEQICRAAGMKPAKRDTINGAEIFVADGFSLPPHMKFWRFGVDPFDFPHGMYATLWWASKGDEKLDMGQPLFFDVHHNPEYTWPDKQRARINTAMKEADTFLQRRKRERAHAH